MKLKPSLLCALGLGLDDKVLKLMQNLIRVLFNKSVRRFFLHSCFVSHHQSPILNLFQYFNFETLAVS